MENYSRRNFLRRALTTSAALATVGLSRPSIAAKPIHWKMVTAWPKNFPALGIGANKLARSIEELSHGRLKIKVYGAGELVPAYEIFDAVSNGTAQCGHGASYYWKGKSDAAQFFGSIPFGFTRSEMNAWLYYGGGLELWQQLYARFHLIPFPVGNTGVQMGGWFNKSVNSLADLKGLKMRIPGLGGEVMKRAGAVPVNIPGGEVFTSLQAGTIDAVEWSGPYNDLAFGLYRAAKYYYTPGWHEPGTALECFFNQKAYQALPEDLQAIVRFACQAANADLTADYTAQNAHAYHTLITKHKVKVKQFPQSVLKRLRKISDEVLGEIAAKDKLSGEIYKSYRDFRRLIVDYHNVNERFYMNIRDE